MKFLKFIEDPFCEVDEPAECLLVNMKDFHYIKVKSLEGMLNHGEATTAEIKIFSEKKPISVGCNLNKLDAFEEFISDEEKTGDIFVFVRQKFTEFS